MARKLRIQFPGAIYHLMSRGDRREDIFRDDVDRERFIETLGEACSKTSWQVHAFCLMRNHFHLIVETPEPDLVAGMKWMLGTYTMRFNRRHALSGHLFAGRYRSQVIGGEGGYLRTACDYVHLNPVRAGLLDAGDPVRSYSWSSVVLYLLPPKLRPAWMRVDRLFGECGIAEDSESGRTEFEHRLESRRAQEESKNYRGMRDGWCVGDDGFRQELLAQVNARKGVHYYGRELSEAAEARAKRIVREELEKIGWSEPSLATRRKGAPEKVAIARRLRTETTMTLDWIAKWLCMGAKGHLSHLLSRRDTRLAGKIIANHRSKLRAAHSRRVAVVPITIQEVTIPRTDPSSDQFDTSFD